MAQFTRLSAIIQNLKSTTTLPAVTVQYENVTLEQKVIIFINYASQNVSYSLYTRSPLPTLY